MREICPSVFSGPTFSYTGRIVVHKVCASSAKWKEMRAAHIMDRALPLNLPRPPWLAAGCTTECALCKIPPRLALPCAQNQLPRVYLVGLAGERHKRRTFVSAARTLEADDDGERISLSAPR